MNSINEKEKKLNIALEELKNLDLTNPELQKNIENLSEDLKSKARLEERKQIEFSEKIDELNQETDTLLDEIDKWQM